MKKMLSIQRIELLGCLVLGWLGGSWACGAQAKEGQEGSLRVHFISGNREYQSQESLKVFQGYLEANYRVEVSGSWVQDGAKDLPGIARIGDADVLLVFARRMKLPEDQMAVIRRHWEQGKGVVGIRTASHAFGQEDNAVFDGEVLGGNYQGHFGDDPVEVLTTEAGRIHAVLAGVGPFRSRKLYKAGPLADSAVVLQEGRIQDQDTHPVTWVNSYKGGRMFYTSLGVPEDFGEGSFRQMLANAIFWVAGLDSATMRKGLSAGSRFAVVDPTEVDHAANLRSWDEQTYKRGEMIYQISCAACHGVDGLVAPNPLSALFAKDPLKNGSDPFRMWLTLSNGYGNMLPQIWLTPEQRYEVIHYIREKMFRESNPSQYSPITESYLASLPRAAEGKKKAIGEMPDMDYGPAMTYEVEGIRSGLTVRLSSDVNILYDLHRMAGVQVWRGGWLNLSESHHKQYKGGGRGVITGEKIPMGEFVWGYEGSFEDPREEDRRVGPVGRERIDYHGYYLNGMQVVLSYAVKGREVLEVPGVIGRDDVLVLTHTLGIGGGKEGLDLCVGQVEKPGETWLESEKGDRKMVRSGGAAGNVVVCKGSSGVVAAGVVGIAKGSSWEVDGQGRLVLHIPAGGEGHTVRIFRTWGERAEGVVDRLRQLIAETGQVDDPAGLIRGGPGRWGDALKMAGRLGTQDGPYALDTIDVPLENPWHSWMRLSGLDFFSDGRMAVSTFNGDVWILSGIDEGLEEVDWRRFATGLYEPLGLKIVKDRVYVTGRDRITRLGDLNGDGEADRYESFHAFDHVGKGYHDFVFDLHTDSQGNFYCVKSGRKSDFRVSGGVLRIRPDGSGSEIVATGFRHPNGMTVGHGDGIYVSDNQGEWIPSSKVSFIREGGFYGYAREKRFERKTFERPLFWLPHDLDSSSGGQLWAEDSRWGPLAGTMLHTSYGAMRLFYCMVEEVEGIYQAAVVPFGWEFESGIMRARVNPADGQVWVIGQRGWDTRAKLDGCVNRIRYTGQGGNLVTGSGVTSRGVRLRFREPLERGGALDVNRYKVERWNYLWSEKYGSAHYHPVTGEEETERVVVGDIELSEDGREVELVIAGHRPVDQMKVEVDLPTLGGQVVNQTIYFTINRVPGGNRN